MWKEFTTAWTTAWTFLATKKDLRNFLSPWFIWWSWSGSNWRPLECHSSALPTELQPHSRIFLITKPIWGVNHYLVWVVNSLLTAVDGLVIIPDTCRSGEIGRRTGLKIQRPRGHAGSTPASGTRTKSNEVQCSIKSSDKSGLFYCCLSNLVLYCLS